jgi:hypothetical protein
VFLPLNFEASKLASIGGLRNAYIEGFEESAKNMQKSKSKERSSVSYARRLWL